MSYVIKRFLCSWGNDNIISHKSLPFWFVILTSVLYVLFVAIFRAALCTVNHVFEGNSNDRTPQDQKMFSVCISDGFSLYLRWFLFVSQMVSVCISDGFSLYLRWFLFVSQMVSVCISDGFSLYLRWWCCVVLSRWPARTGSVVGRTRDSLMLCYVSAVVVTSWIPGHPRRLN